MGSDAVLWWGLLLVVVAVLYTYRTEMLDIVWNRPADQNNHLFDTNPAEYGVHILAEGVKGAVGGIF